MTAYDSPAPAPMPAGGSMTPPKCFQTDIETVGIPYVVEGPDGPLYADFHALRHSYVALLDRAGVSLKQAMQLARHSDPKLTMAIYGRAQIHDLGAAVDALPSLSFHQEVTSQILPAFRRPGQTAMVCRRFAQGLHIPMPGNARTWKGMREP